MYLLFNLSMKVTSYIAITSILLGSSTAFAVKNTSPLSFSYDEYEVSAYSKKNAVVNWNSEDGIKRLNNSKYKDDFYRLAHHVKYQEHPATCGIATAVSVLGAIYEQKGIKMPLVASYPISINGETVGLEYKTWNEDVFFNDSTDKIVDRRSVMMKYPRDVKNGKFMGGIDMSELAKMLKIHNVSSKITEVKEVTSDGIEKFRNIVKSVVMSKEKFVIANYNRGYQSMEMGGHYSPIAAYDQESDSILILDVAGHKNPWIWVSVEDFYKSMNSKNYAGTNYRGYMIVQ